MSTWCLNCSSTPYLSPSPVQLEFTVQQATNLPHFLLSRPEAAPCQFQRSSLHALPLHSGQTTTALSFTSRLPFPMQILLITPSQLAAMPSHQPTCMRDFSSPISQSPAHVPSQQISGMPSRLLLDAPAICTCCSFSMLSRHAIFTSCACQARPCCSHVHRQAAMHHSTRHRRL